MKNKNVNNSDKLAKLQLINYLTEKGYSQGKESNSGEYDVSAIDSEGRLRYFEIKCTKRKDTYFGASTLTELVFALKNNTDYQFVIAVWNHGKQLYEFAFLTAEDLIAQSSLPPFKVYFSLKLSDILKPKKFRKNTVKMTKNIVNKLNKFYNSLKSA